MLVRIRCFVLLWFCSDSHGGCVDGSVAYVITFRQIVTVLSIYIVNSRSDDALELRNAKSIWCKSYNLNLLLYIRTAKLLKCDVCRTISHESFCKDLAQTWRRRQFDDIGLPRKALWWGGHIAWSAFWSNDKHFTTSFWRFLQWRQLNNIGLSTKTSLWRAHMHEMLFEVMRSTWRQGVEDVLETNWRLKQRFNLTTSVCGEETSWWGANIHEMVFELMRSTKLAFSFFCVWK